LIGKTVDGKSVREAIGNVSLTHNNVHITCGRVVQFIDENKADLYTNVHVVKDTLTINAPMGTYYGNESKVVCPSGATLNDSKTTLKANYGIYFFNEDLAQFRGNVRVTDNKYTITSDELKYYRSVGKSFANGNVKIVTDSAIIYTDDLVHEKLTGISTAKGSVKIESDSTIITSDNGTYYEFEKKSIAQDNVKINFTNKNSVIYGDYGENYERTNYSFIKGNARLIQIETKDGKTDTLFIFSRQMESFRNKPEHYIAKDSVKMIRTDFFSSSQVGYYFRDASGKGGVIALSKDPAVWKDNLQVTGDSIYANFKDEIQDIYVNRSAFALQAPEENPDRYDQISGIFMYMKFLDNEINYIRVDTNAASIYFAYDNKNPNGANKSNGEVITLHFKDKQVTKVKIAGKPKGTFYPEDLVSPSALRLLGFRIRNDKPVRLF
jgi:lipopolysaccharide export system protein LptA